MTLTDGERLFGAVLADPEDWDGYRVYADWLEENGRDDEARALRWMAAEHKRPYDRVEGKWIWYRKISEWDTTHDRLPPEIYKRLRLGREHTHEAGRYSRTEYQSRRDAIEDFISAAKGVI